MTGDYKAALAAMDEMTAENQRLGFYHTSNHPFSSNTNPLMKSYEEQRQERLADSVSEYLDTDVPNLMLLVDLEKCLQGEFDYYNGQAERARTLLNAVQAAMDGVCEGVG